MTWIIMIGYEVVALQIVACEENLCTPRVLAKRSPQYGSTPYRGTHSLAD
jgi:hypothetical protein